MAVLEQEFAYHKLKQAANKKCLDQDMLAFTVNITPSNTNTPEVSSCNCEETRAASSCPQHSKTRASLLQP